MTTTLFRVSQPAVLIPLAAFRMHGTTTTSAHFPNSSRSWQSPHSPTPDTYAAGPQRAAFRAVFLSRGGSFSYGPPRAVPARCSDACPLLRKAFHLLLRRLRLPEHPSRFPASHGGGPAKS